MTQIAFNRSIYTMKPLNLLLILCFNRSQITFFYPSLYIFYRILSNILLLSLFENFIILVPYYHRKIIKYQKLSFLFLQKPFISP